MRTISIFLTAVFTLASCAGKPVNSELESSSKKVYGIKFVQKDTKVTIVFTDGKDVVASAPCSYQMIGAPSVGGPVHGTIRCSDRETRITAAFDTIGSDGKIWAGRASFGNPPKGGAYGCSHSLTSGNVLDCYYKAPGTPPTPGGGVSN